MREGGNLIQRHYFLIQPVLVQPTLHRWLKNASEKPVHYEKEPEGKQSTHNKTELKNSSSYDNYTLKMPLDLDIGCDNKTNIVSETSPSPDPLPDCPLTTSQVHSTITACVPLSKKKLSLKKRKKSSLQEQNSVYAAQKTEHQVSKTNQGSTNSKKVCEVTHQAKRIALMSADDWEIMKSYSVAATEVNSAPLALEKVDAVTPRKALSVKDSSNSDLPISPTFSPRKVTSLAFLSPLCSSLTRHERKSLTPCFNTSIPLFSTPNHSDAATPKSLSAEAARRTLFHHSDTTTNGQDKHESDISFNDDISLSEFLNSSLSGSNRACGINQYLVLEVDGQSSIEVGDNRRYIPRFYISVNTVFRQLHSQAQA